MITNKSKKLLVQLKLANVNIDIKVYFVKSGNAFNWHICFLPEMSQAERGLDVISLKMTSSNLTFRPCVVKKENGCFSVLKS